MEKSNRKIGQVQQELIQQAMKNRDCKEYWELVLELAVLQDNQPMIIKAKAKL